MPFHLVGYSGSVATGSALLKLPALTDLFSNIQNNNLVVDSKVNQLMAAFAYGPNCSRAQLQEPVLQVPGYPDIRRIGQSVPTDAIKPAVEELLDSPFGLKPTEQLSFYTINAGGSAEQEYGLVWLADQVPQPTKGKIFTLKLTGSTTLTANAWSSVPLSFEDNLPAGNYALVGARAESAGCIAFRMGAAGFAYRPGGIGSQAVKSVEWPLQRFGGLGTWFTFANTVQLVADFLSSSGDTSEIVYVDLIGPQ